MMSATTSCERRVPSRVDDIFYGGQSGNRDHPPRIPSKQYTMITIKFLEKLSEKSLLLSWREPARCNYTEQLWVLYKAPAETTCAVTGERIRRGERVYAPVGQPSNHGKCIRRDAFPLR